MISESLLQQQQGIMKMRDLLLRYTDVLKKTPFKILTKDMKTMLIAYRLFRMNTNRMSAPQFYFMY